MNSIKGFFRRSRLQRLQQMTRLKPYSELRWNHDFWSLLRFFRSLRLGSAAAVSGWLTTLKKEGSLAGPVRSFPIDPALIDLLITYVPASAKMLGMALGSLRSEEEAISFCGKNKLAFGSTTTKNKTHHQSSKALISAVSGIAKRVCKEAGTTLDPDPQRRAVWFSEKGLHVSARNLDGAMPSLENPTLVWEIKEYWGKTKGGSKMSDAVYECHLVGLELRMFEEKIGRSIRHAVFVDGKEQWSHRKSDLLRFIDLHQQGLIDHLIIGREVETEWPLIARHSALIGLL